MSMMSSIKQALGGHKKEKPADTAAESGASPLATGAHRLEGDGPAMHSNTTTKTVDGTAPMHSNTTMKAVDGTAPMKGAAPMDGTSGVKQGTTGMGMFEGAPWEQHHESTLNALQHAKLAHIKAVQAQHELQAATQAKQDAEEAERRRLELERETGLHRQGHEDLGARTREWEDAKSGLAQHKKAHDHHMGLARDAEAAALAKEEEAKRLAPLHQQHMRGLAPLQEQHTAAQRELAQAEERRAALVRELEALDATMGGLRTRHQGAAQKLEEHNRLGGGHKERALAAAEEARLLRAKATEANAALEPHAARVKDAHGLLATRESAYNKAREHAAAAKERLPALQSQADEAARKAKMSALAAQQHAGAFEKLKKEAEAEDAQKAALWADVQKKGHLSGEGATKAELHNLADRFHTVLQNPIDTGALANPNVTTEIRQSASRIAGGGPAGSHVTSTTTGTGMGPAKTATTTAERDLGRETAPATPGREELPGTIRKGTSITTPAHTHAPLVEE